MTASSVSNDSRKSDFTIRFWGVRGSIASPGPDTVRYGGNTSCIEVRCGDALLVFDAGTGLRALGERLMAEGEVDCDLFLTHSHFDHICGIPFFAPAFNCCNRMRMWAGHLLPERDLRAALDGMMASPLFPVPVDIFKAKCSFHDFRCGETLEPKPGIVLKTGELNHPDRAVGYRLEFGGRSFCYITDTEQPAEGRDQAIVELVRGADVMVYDSTYTDEEYADRIGWGHSTWQECLRLADEAGVGRAVIFHHDPARTDEALDVIAEEAEKLRPGTLIAREGMVINL